MFWGQLRTIEVAVWGTPAPDGPSGSTTVAAAPKLTRYLRFPDRVWAGSHNRFVPLSDNTGRMVTPWLPIWNWLMALDSCKLMCCCSTRASVAAFTTIWFL
jgi:hypothetical protein